MKRTIIPDSETERNEVSTDKNLADISIAKNFYEARYSNGYMADWPDEKCARVASILRQLPLPPNGKVLDFGCGTAVFTTVLESTLNSWEVHGTDISDKALDIASLKLPACYFHKIDDLEKLTGCFDLIFTHHVLEHVADLRETADKLFKLLSPTGTMFHILPCGDSGSFEHSICTMRLDGITGDSETRFFYEEEGHLRRLTTQKLVDLWKVNGFYALKTYYANQLYGAIKFITGNNLSFVLSLTDTSFAKNSYAAYKLFLYRLLFTVIWCLRKPATVLKYKKQYGLKDFRDYILVIFSLLLYPIAWLTERLLNNLVDKEWSCRCQDFGGSEMYVYLTRESR